MHRDLLQPSASATLLPQRPPRGPPWLALRPCPRYEAASLLTLNSGVFRKKHNRKTTSLKTMKPISIEYCSPHNFEGSFLNFWYKMIVAGHDTEIGRLVVPGKMPLPMLGLLPGPSFAGKDVRMPPLRMECWGRNDVTSKNHLSFRVNMKETMHIRATQIFYETNLYDIQNSSMCHPCSAKEDPEKNSPLKKSAKNILKST